MLTGILVPDGCHSALRKLLPELFTVRNFSSIFYYLTCRRGLGDLLSVTESKSFCYRLLGPASRHELLILFSFGDLSAIRRRQQSLQLAVLSTLAFHICPHVANEWKAHPVRVRYEVLTVAMLKIQIFWNVYNASIGI